MKRLYLAAAFAISASAQAQVVEHPEPFDSAGRVMVITPAIAARLQLLPPAWRITGQFSEARLFTAGDSAFVLVVNRPDGAVERYPLTIDERAYLRERTSTLPPSLINVAKEAAESRGNRRGFIRNQTLLGLGIYAPAAAIALSDDGAGQTAIYLLVAGGSYFAAATLSREITITEQMNSLSTHMASRGALMGLGGTFAMGLGFDGRAAGVFATSLIGTAAGLRLARNLTPGEARSSGFGADASTIVMSGLMLATIPDLNGSDDVTEEEDIARTRVGAVVVAGALGYPLGLMYARRANYNITSGDIGTLWVSGAIGSLATTPFIINSTNDDLRFAVGVMTAGFVGGLVAGDRMLVRRFDHSTGEATLVTLGAGAGALMGGGIYVLVDRDTKHDALGLSLATLGAVAGVAATERAFPPDGDAGRMASRVRFNPTGALLAAAGVRGTFPLVRVVF
jgi:hypothetical protein